MIGDPMMSKMVRSKDSTGIENTLILEEADMAVLDLLRNKTSGGVKLTISHATVHGDIINITKDRRIYEFQRKDLYKW
jgi:hypothetical protein